MQAQVSGRCLLSIDVLERESGSVVMDVERVPEAPPSSGPSTPGYDPSGATGCAGVGSVVLMRTREERPATAFAQTSTVAREMTRVSIQLKTPEPRLGWDLPSRRPTDLRHPLDVRGYARRRLRAPSRLPAPIRLPGQTDRGREPATLPRRMSKKQIVRLIRNVGAPNAPTKSSKASSGWITSRAVPSPLGSRGRSRRSARGRGLNDTSWTPSSRFDWRLPARSLAGYPAVPSRRSARRSNLAVVLGCGDAI